MCVCFHVFVRVCEVWVCAQACVYMFVQKREREREEPAKFEVNCFILIFGQARIFDRFSHRRISFCLFS